MRRERRFNFATYDIETPGIGDDSFLLVGYYDGERYYRFYRMADFMDHVCSRRYRGWHVFGHYAGRFDARYLLDYLRFSRAGKRLRWSYYLSGSSCVLLSIHTEENGRGGHVVHFADSGRLLLVSLGRLTSEFKVQHRKMDFDPSSVRYNFNDCVGLYEVLQEFFSLTGVYAYTVASAALRYFRKNYLQRSIWQLNPSVENFVREGYYGGRCEIYRRDPVDGAYKYDVNSLYPYAMVGPIPVEYLGRTRSIPDDDRRIGFFRADVHLPDTYIPALPIMTGESRLYFPVGAITGVWTSMEIRRAIEDGAAVRVRDGVVFATDSIFDEFVADIYTRKAEAEASGDFGKRLIFKLLANSLYGKFGQRRDRRVYIDDPGTARLDADDPSSPAIWPLPGGAAYYITESDARHILPHISASITARARLTMLDRLRDAVPCWYTDTDSVITTRKLETGDGLGEWKLEGIGSFQAHGLKEYSWNDEIKIKGLPRQDLEIARRYLNGEQVAFRRMAGLQESVRAGVEAARSIDCVRRRRSSRPKRAADGTYDTRPWNMSELV